MARTIAVAMRKGGSGKTTTTVNLAAALALRDKRVLLVDLDPQANATVAVGIDPTAIPKHIGHLFSDPTLELWQATYDVGNGLFVMPTLLNPRTNISKSVLDSAFEAYPDLVYPFGVDYSVRHPEATLAGVPIVIWEPEHNGAIVYKKLAEVVDGQA